MNICGYVCSSDPFNRQPLKVEDLQPNKELFDQMQAWKKQQRAIRRRSLENTPAGTPNTVSALQATQGENNFDEIKGEEKDSDHAEKKILEDSEDVAEQ